MQGLIYMELREDGPARETFERALSLSANNPDVQNNYGWFLCTRNDTTRGLELMQRAITNPLYSTPEKAFLSRGPVPEARRAARRKPRRACAARC